MGQQETAVALLVAAMVELNQQEAELPCSFSINRKSQVRAAWLCQLFRVHTGYMGYVLYWRHG